MNVSQFWVELFLKSCHNNQINKKIKFAVKSKKKFTYYEKTKNVFTGKQI